MKNITIILLLASFSSFASTVQNSLIGEWEQFTSGLNPKYTYIRFNNDLTGIFATTRNGRVDIEYIKKEQISINDETIEIVFPELNNFSAKIILSAYETSKNEGLATGMLYMYEKKKGYKKLFNTIFLRLVKINKSSFNKEVTKLHKQLNN